jgi:hypothetical protein
MGMTAVDLVESAYTASSMGQGNNPVGILVAVVAAALALALPRSMLPLMI